MNIYWKDSIWFFDLDDTLINTAGAGLIASDGIYDFLSKEIGAQSTQKIRDRFIQLFDLLLLGYRVKSEEGWKQILGGKKSYDELLVKIKNTQPAVIKRYGHEKKWSREVLIKIAADDNNLNLSPTQVQNAANAYWNDLADKVELTRGAASLLRTIHQHNRPAYIITSSDGRLEMQKDGKFIYEPEYSEKLKSDRVEKMKEKGLIYSAYRIGDPEDKPHLDFFEKIINVANKDLGRIDYKNCIMFGDSYSGDLETPRKSLHFGLVVHIDGQHDVVEELADDYIVAGDLEQFLKWFESKQ